MARRRLFHQAVTLAGAVALVSAMFAAKHVFETRQRAEDARAERRIAEGDHIAGEAPLLSWDLLREADTAARLPAFPPELRKLEGRVVDLAGFPLAGPALADTKRFLLAALPPDSYALGIPGTDLVQIHIESDRFPPDPDRAYLLHGTLRLTTGEDGQAFFTLDTADWQSANLETAADGEEPLTKEGTTDKGDKTGAG